MKRSNIGVRLNDFRTNAKKAISYASQMGFVAVEASSDGEEISPDQLSESGRQHLARLIRGQGLSFNSLASHATGRGIADSAQVNRIVDQTVALFRLAADMHVPIVSSQIGNLPQLDGSVRAAVVDTMKELTGQAEQFGVVYAIRATGCAPDQIHTVIQEVGCPSLQLALDPGELLMTGFDPSDSLTNLGAKPMLAYLRDATAYCGDHSGHETPIGTGSLDLQAYLALLDASECTGPHILRRSSTVNPVGDISADKKTIEAYLLH